MVMFLVWWAVIGVVVTITGWIYDDLTDRWMYQHPLDLLFSVGVWPLVIYWIVWETIYFLQQQGKNVEDNKKY